MEGHKQLEHRVSVCKLRDYHCQKGRGGGTGHGLVSVVRAETSGPLLYDALYWGYHVHNLARQHLNLALAERIFNFYLKSGPS